MIILGINAFHADSAAALVRDGMLVAAVEEERFRRIKHWAGFPERAIDYCLREAGVSLSDVDHVAVNQDGRANVARKLGYLLSHRPDLGLVIARWRNRSGSIPAVCSPPPSVWEPAWPPWAVVLALMFSLSLQPIRCNISSTS